MRVFFTCEIVFLKREDRVLKTSSQLPLARRSFLSRLGVGLSAFGATLGGGASTARAQSPQEGRWQPSRHSTDDWFDQLPGKHRFFFDTTSPGAIGQAIAFATNYFTANKSGYGLEDGDLAVVICVRHQSTAFAFNDAMWAKYGAPLAERAGFTDPKTKQPPTINVYNSSAYTELANRGITVDALIKRGVHFAVCGLSTRANAAAIAQKTGGKADEIFAELAAQLVGNAHLVPAGIVAVNRAQEHGYSFAYVG